MSESLVSYYLLVDKQNNPAKVADSYQGALNLLSQDIETVHYFSGRGSHMGKFMVSFVDGQPTLTRECDAQLQH